MHTCTVARALWHAVGSQVERGVRLHLGATMLIQGWLALLVGALAFVGFVVVGAALLKFALFIAVKISDAVNPAPKETPTAPRNQT